MHVIVINLNWNEYITYEIFISNSISNVLINEYKYNS